jgi:hypothetical protein
MKGQLDVSTPKEYLAALEEPRRSQVAKLDKLVRKSAPKLKPFIHSGMLAFGPCHYKYASGREGDWFRIGIASNASYISLYACAADERGYVAERYKAQLPKAKIGKSCVRFKKLEDLDLKVLEALIKETAKTDFSV